MRHGVNEYEIEFLQQVSRRLQESASRLHTCLGMLTTEEIWEKPNEHSNSVGNIVLHLCGNVRQWVISGLGGAPDMRERGEEFSQRIPLSASTLLKRIDQVMTEVETLLGRIDEKKLFALHRVQGFDETGIAILLHVVEHFSYHVGQITYYVKLAKNTDTNYYKGVDLNKRR